MTTELLHGLLDAAAGRSPDAPAVTCDGDTLSYAELAAASRRAAAWLRRLGVGRGDRVVVLAPTRPATVALVYGCSRIGAVFVLLHEQVRGPGLAHVLDDAEPALLVTDDAAAVTAATARGIPVCPVAMPGDPGDPTADPTADPTVPAGHTVAGLGDAEPASHAAGRGRPPGGPLAVDPVCLIYTSGSTGMPKAVVSTHGQVTFVARAIHGELGYRADDVVYVGLPLSFDYGLYQVFLAALGGAHAWLGSAADLGPVLLRDLRRSGATVLPAVPSLAENLATMLARYGGELALRLLTNTGAAMPPSTLAALRARLPALRVQLMMGLTECKRVSIMPPDEDLRRPGASGRPLPGTEVLVLDEDGRPLPAGEVGELVIRGPHVMAGYWRRPELTAHRFRRVDGLFPRLHSGDHGWLDEDGFVYFAGRRDDLYKSRGFRVSATEVEAAACRLPEVSAAAVVPPGPGRPDAVLFVVSTLTGDQVRQRMRAEIEPFKVPARCLVLNALPLTPNGKIDRKELADWLGGEAAVDDQHLTGDVRGPV